MHDADHVAAASSVWRSAKLQEFGKRLSSLNLVQNVIASELLQRMEAETNAVQALQEQQILQDSTAPWWADGDYDDVRADRANDLGLQLFRAKDYGTAFAHYTEAIRLCPRKSTYHCNRAAAALKLQQYAIAAEDASHAIERDSQNVKAYVRAGHAKLGLQQPNNAADMFRQALNLDASSAAAQRGLEAATRAQGRAGAKALQEQAAADKGDRPGLIRQAVDAEQAAQMLDSAQGMLQAQPDSHAVLCSFAEALIACRRYQDAMKAVCRLAAGVDKLYLQAEVLWRQSDITSAAGILAGACQQSPGSSKCRELQLWVQSLQHTTHQADVACEDGSLDTGITMYSELLTALQPAMCSGLYAQLLHRKANAQRRQQQYGAALQSLDSALEWEPEDASCLQSRAMVHQEVGNYTQSFMDLQKLGKLKPDSTELFEQLQQAAHLCLGSRDTSWSKIQPHSRYRASYSVLGLHPDASSADIRHAYRQKASKWHPDKWASCSKQSQDAAAHRFSQIAEAYAMLSDH